MTQRTAPLTSLERLKSTSLLASEAVEIGDRTLEAMSRDEGKSTYSSSLSVSFGKIGVAVLTSPFSFH